MNLDYDIGSKLTELKSSLDRKRGKKEQLLQDFKETKEEITETKGQIYVYEKAQVIIQEVATLTQKELEFHISELVSLILESVFDDPYKMRLDFIIRRGKTEANIIFTKDGHEVDPASSSGGGVIDIASFALRVCLWAIKNPRSRNTILLDEPFKHLSGDLREKAGQMLEEISRKLNLQIILITHDLKLVKYADKVFKVKKIGRKSRVQCLTNEKTAF